MAERTSTPTTARAKDAASTAKDKAKGAASTAKDRAQDAAGSAKEAIQEKAGQAAEQARTRSQQARERVGGMVRQEVERRSSQAGDQVNAVAEALNRTAEGLEEEGKDGPARLARTAAGRLGGVGSYLSGSTADDIMSDVEDFARRQPWLTAAAGLVVGVAAARFLKASRPPTTPSYPIEPSTPVPTRTPTARATVTPQASLPSA